MLQSASSLSTIPPMFPKTGRDSRDQNGHCEDAVGAPPPSLTGTTSTSTGSCSPSTPITNTTAHSRTPRPGTTISVSDSLAKDSNTNRSLRPFPPSSQFTHTSSYSSSPHYPREPFSHPFTGSGVGSHRPPTGGSVGHLSYHNHPHYHYYNQHSPHYHHNPHPHHSYQTHHYAHSNSVHSHGYSNTSPTPVSRAQTATYQLQDFMLGQWTQFRRNNRHATLGQPRIPPAISNTATANCSPSEDSATTSPSPTPQSSATITDRGLPSSRAHDYNLNGSLPRRHAPSHQEGGSMTTEFASSGMNYRRRGGPISQMSRQSNSDVTLWQRGHPSARKTSSPTAFTSRGSTMHGCNRPTGQPGYTTTTPVRASNASPSQVNDRTNINNNACPPAVSASHGFSGSTPSSPGHGSQPSSLRGSPAHSRPRRSVPDRPTPRECSSPGLSQVRASPEHAQPATPQSPKITDAQPTSDKPGMEPNSSPDSSSTTPVPHSSVTSTDRSSPDVCHTMDDAKPVTLEVRTPEVSSTESLSRPQSGEYVLANRNNSTASTVDSGCGRLELAVSECVDKQLTTPMCVNVAPSTVVNSSKHDRADTPTASEQYWTPDPPASPSNGNALIRDEIHKSQEVSVALLSKSPDSGDISTAASHPASPPGSPNWKQSPNSVHGSPRPRLESLNDVD